MHTLAISGAWDEFDARTTDGAVLVRVLMHEADDVAIGVPCTGGAARG